MRRCSQCAALDREILVPGQDSEHWVVPELRWAQGREKDAGGKPVLSRREREAGWEARIVQGKPAMTRMCCRGCLNRNALRDGFWGSLRQAAAELEAAPADTYYRDLCEASV